MEYFSEDLFPERTTNIGPCSEVLWNDQNWLIFRKAWFLKNSAISKGTFGQSYTKLVARIFFTVWHMFVITTVDIVCRGFWTIHSCLSEILLIPADNFISPCIFIVLVWPGPTRFTFWTEWVLARPVWSGPTRSGPDQSGLAQMIHLPDWMQCANGRVLASSSTSKAEYWRGLVWWYLPTNTCWGI